jgi:hypothetical protein
MLKQKTRCPFSQKEKTRFLGHEDRGNGFERLLRRTYRLRDGSAFSAAPCKRTWTISFSPREQRIGKHRTQWPDTNCSMRPRQSIDNLNLGRKYVGADNTHILLRVPHLFLGLAYQWHTCHSSSKSPSLCATTLPWCHRPPRSLPLRVLSVSAAACRRLVLILASLLALANT